MLEKQFGQRLKQLRKERRITQEHLAEAVGVDVRTIQRWESGETGPEFSRLGIIAQTLRVPVSELFIPQKGGQKRKPKKSQNF